MIKKREFKYFNQSDCHVAKDLKDTLKVFDDLKNKQKSVENKAF